MKISLIDVDSTKFGNLPYKPQKKHNIKTA